MKQIHKKLLKKSKAYAKWHKHPMHKAVHWVAFSFISVLVAQSLVQSSLNPSDSTTLDKKDTKMYERLGGTPDLAAGTVLVKYKPTVTNSKKLAIEQKHNLKEQKTIKEIGVKLLTFDAENNTIQEVIDRLTSEADVLFAEPDYIAVGNAVPNDPDYPAQWHLPDISAPSGWDVSTGSSSVVIAVVDSGVDASHPDLAGKVVPGWSFLTATADTQDVYGHGTAVAGVAAAVTNNANQVAGVSWNAKIMPLVVLNSSNYATYSNIASAFTYAADRGVKIVSISISGTNYSSTLQSAVDYAWNKGTAIFASAGNANTSAPAYPAALDKVVAVASVDPGNARSAFSNWGSWISVTAPGNSILTSTWGGGVAYKSGTSFSTPIVSGVASIARSLNTSLSPSQLVNIIKTSTDDLGTPGFDEYFGWGRVNLAKVAANVASTPVDTQAPSVPTLSAAYNGSNAVLLTWTPAVDNVGVKAYQVFKNGILLATSYTSTSFTDVNVSSGTSYGYTVKAYDEAGNYSAESNIAVVTIPVQSSKVIVTSYQVTSKTANSAVIRWTTNIPSTGAVYYGTAAASLSSSLSDFTVGTTHTVTLNGLAKKTTYYYRIDAISQDNTSTASSPVTNFRTNNR